MSYAPGGPSGGDQDTNLRIFIAAVIIVSLFLLAVVLLRGAW